MAKIPKKAVVEKLKKQDKELAGLPDIDKEKRTFLKGESRLKKWVKPKKIGFDFKKLAESKRKQISKIKKKASQKPSSLKKVRRK